MLARVVSGMRNVGLRQLMSAADVTDVVRGSSRRPVLVFKHSTRCGISAAAHRQWQHFLSLPEAQAVDHAWVRVIEERAASQELARQAGVAHESPQVLLIANGRTLWHAAGAAITADALIRALTPPVRGPSPRGRR